jgi:hypothetical protein
MKALYDKGCVGNDYDQKRQALQQAQEEVRAARDHMEVVRDGVAAQNASTSSSSYGRPSADSSVSVKVGNTVILSNTSTTVPPSPMWPTWATSSSGAMSTRPRWDSW